MPVVASWAAVHGGGVLRTTASVSITVGVIDVSRAPAVAVLTADGGPTRVVPTTRSSAVQATTHVPVDADSRQVPAISPPRPAGLIRRAPSTPRERITSPNDTPGSSDTANTVGRVCESSAGRSPPHDTTGSPPVEPSGTDDGRSSGSTTVVAVHGSTSTTMPAPMFAAATVSASGAISGQLVDGGSWAVNRSSRCRAAAMATDGWVVYTVAGRTPAASAASPPATPPAIASTATAVPITRRRAHRSLPDRHVAPCVRRASTRGDARPAQRRDDVATTTLQPTRNERVMIGHHYDPHRVESGDGDVRAPRAGVRDVSTIEPTVRANVELYAALLRGQLRGDDALEASQQLLQALMHSSANAVFWKDRSSRYLGCNHVFAAFAGTEPDDLIGKSDRDMPWADDAEFGADWFMDWDAHVAATGEPVVGIVERLRRARGDLRWVETQKVPLRDLDGEVIGILGTFEDVTERRAAEEQLNRTLADLDKRVQQRTRDLERAIESLRREVDDRVRVQAEERQQRAYAEALRDTASAMSKTLDLSEVMEQVLIGVERLVSNDLTAIVLAGADEHLELARCRVGFGYAAEVGDAAPGVESLTAVRELLDGREYVVVDDPPCAFGPCGSVLGAALQVGDRHIGYVVLESVTRGFFTPSHAERLQAIADVAAAAISNARLAGQASELAAAEERQRLSRELHDAVNQTLWTAALTADSLLREVDPDTRVARPHRAAAPAHPRRPGGDAHPAAGAAPARARRDRAARAARTAHRRDGVPQADAGDRPAPAGRARGDRTGDAVPHRPGGAHQRDPPLGRQRRVDHAGTAQGARGTRRRHVMLRVADNGRGFESTAWRPGTSGCRSCASGRRPSPPISPCAPPPATGPS